MTETYRIPKDRARVTLHPADVETDLFISRDARQHGGHETISDLVRDPAPFLPTHLDEGFAVFRKDRIDWIRIHDPLETEGAFVESDELDRRLAVRIAFESGAVLEGAFLFGAPATASRLSDVANSDVRWIHFEDDEAHYLVNLTRVTRIDSLSREEP